MRPFQNWICIPINERRCDRNFIRVGLSAFLPLARPSYNPAMSDDRKPLWPWVVALLIGLPVLYVASFGPAMALYARGRIPLDAAAIVCGPTARCMTDRHCPRPITNWMAQWANLFGVSDIELFFLLWDVQHPELDD